MDKQNNILISVIIPSYNRANTVGETIESIMAQEGIDSEYDLEIVIGDDCSTDNAREVLEQYRQKYPDYIRLFLREENVGLGANWALCVKDCRGKYICNCDNDDYWHNPQKLHLQLQYMESHPECNVLLTNHRTHNRSTGEIKEKVAIIEGKTQQDAVLGFGRLEICNATIMYRADYMKAHVDLDEFIRRRFSLQDWPAWAILTAHTNMEILPVSTATFGIETVSITRPDTYEAYIKRYKKDEIVTNYLKELFPEKYPLSDDPVDHYLYTVLMNMAFRKHDFPAAKEYGKDANNGFKQKCSQNRLGFEIYYLLNKLKKAILCPK